MESAKQSATGPLGNQSAEEIEYLLRGFPDSAISSALALRDTFNNQALESCLLGILKFYLPEGAQTAESQTAESNDHGIIRIKEDLGLDSLSIAESMFKIEELFDIPIEYDEIAEVETIADACRLLTQKMAASEKVAV